MDLCPVCKTATESELRDNNIVWKCRNPQCPNYGKIVDQKEYSAEE